jgi:hypothetical protein
MKLTRTQRWLSTLFLGGVIVTMGGLVYRMVAGGVDPYYENWARESASIRSSLKLSSVTDKRVVLMKGEPVTVDRTRLVYRGLEDGRARLDLYLLDMDSEYAYPRRIPRIDGKIYNLGGHHYEVVATHKRQVVMNRLK